jgi:hypothetical protein
MALMNSLYTYFASIFDIEVKKILGSLIMNCLRGAMLTSSYRR